jgi:dihydroxy-acid dehydratase
MVYGGSIHSGKWKGESLNIVSAFEALGKSSITRLRRTLKELFKTHVPEQVPAEECIQLTMSSAIEALGMSLPYSSSNPALSEEKARMS